MAQRCAPSPFLTKTYELVDDGRTDDVVSWNDSGTAFGVWNIADFAEDLLPKYFKHNNFSSFVRQLNTYGFKKIVPNKWVFANENFNKGQKELIHIQRRCKNVTTSPIQDRKHVCEEGVFLSSPSNSISNSSSSPDSKNIAPNYLSQFAHLSNENKKLKTDNEKLFTELTQAKKQFNELVAFLMEHKNVDPDQINQIITSQGSFGLTHNRSDGWTVTKNTRTILEDEKIEGGGGCNLKLFGVWVKENERKRMRDETSENDEFKAPWMKISGASTKVCNLMII